MGRGRDRDRGAGPGGGDVLFSLRFSSLLQRDRKKAGLSNGRVGEGVVIPSGRGSHFYGDGVALMGGLTVR